jgi:DNA-binding CsgD family transcriptional regulator
MPTMSAVSISDALAVYADETISIPLGTNLSRREAQVAQLLLAGGTRAEIGELLGISPHTVHTHVERIFRKLSVHSRVQLAVVLMKSSR